MRLSSTTAFALALGFAASGSAFAQSTGMANGSQNHSMMKARCSPGDPNVMVDTKAKTYYADNLPVASVAGAPATAHTGDEAAMDQSDAMNKNMKSMCKSEAMSMGAKMTDKPMMAPAASPSP